MAGEDSHLEEAYEDRFISDMDDDPEEPRFIEPEERDQYSAEELKQMAMEAYDDPETGFLAWQQQQDFYRKEGSEKTII